MPVIEVETNVTDAVVKRRFARTVGLWLHRQGVPLAHSIVKYRTIDGAEVFSGPYPFDRVAGDATAPLFAFVTCRVAASRSEAFCRELARVVAVALVPPVTADYLFVAVDPVDPSRHYRWAELVGSRDDGTREEGAS